MQNKERLLELLSITAEMFNTELSEGIIEVYYQTFKDYPDEVIEKAFFDMFKTYKYPTMPKPADIIGTIKPRYSIPHC